MVSAKKFTAYHFVYEQANYSSAKKKNYFSLDSCIAPYYSKGSEISNRLVLATIKQSSRLALKRWKKPPEKAELADEAPRDKKMEVV